MFEDSRRRQGWPEASMEISGKPITAAHPGAPDYLDLVDERAGAVSGSTLSVIAVPGPDGVLRCRASLGEQSLPAGIEIPVSAAITGVLEIGDTAVVPDPGQLFGLGASGKMGPVPIAALGHTGTNNGLLILVRPAGADGYPQSDLESSALFGLSNAIRRSGAKNISISLTANQDNAELLISDDGCGFQNPERISGLANMEQRAASLGGTFNIDSPPGHGTRLCWTAPTT